MANLVEFLVKIKDLASGPLQKLAGTGQSAFAKMESSVNKFGGKLNTLKSSIADIDKQLESLKKTRQISLDGRQITRINKEMDNLQAKKDRLEGGRSGGIGGLFRTGLAIAGIGSAGFLGREIMQAGIGRQMDLTSLQTMLGNKPGQMVNDQLRSYAQRSIYGGEVFNEGKLMAGSGVKANNIMPVMSMIGDIANGDKERMKSLALAFSEANTRGSLTGINERMFLQGGLFNPIEQLHQMTKRSLPDLKKDMEKGKISIDMLVQAMEYATGPLGRWHNSMKNLQSKDSGKWVTLMGTLSMKAGDLGLKLMPLVGIVADFGNSLLGNTPALYGIATAIGAMAAAWAVYTTVTKGAAIWQGILEVIAFWPLALVGALAGGITYLCLKYDNWGKSMLQIWSIAKNVGIGIWDIYKFAAEDIGTLFHLMALKIAASFEFIFTAVQNVKRAMKLALHGDFSEAGKALTAPIKTEAGIRADALGKVYDVQKAAHSAVLKKLFDAKQLNGLDFSMKNPKTGKSPMDALSSFGGKYAASGGDPGGLGSSAKDTGSAITGGGVRNITINVAKFQDKTEIHTIGLKEGVQEVEEMIRDMFLRITNSAATAMS